MADEPPSKGAKFVPYLLDFIALALVFACVDAFVAGRRWYVYVGCLATAILLLFVAFRWGRIEAWLDSSGRSRWQVLAMSALACLTVAAIGYDIYDRHHITENPVSVPAPVPAPQPPHFILSISGGNIFIPTEEPKWTGLALDVSIRNSGGESIATDWKMTISPTGNVVPSLAQLTAIPDFLRAGGVANSVVIKSTDSLEQKTHTTPIGTNHVVDGVLLFYTKLTKHQIEESHTVLDLSVQDIAGNVFSTKQRIGDWLGR